MDEAPSSTPIAWDDSLLLGFTPMDEEHRQFVDLVQTLQSCDASEIARHLASFEAHAKAHFAHEDGWMQETEFPARGCHMDEHAAVLKSVAEVRELVAQGAVALGRDLANELARWFPGHADYLDSALSHWMCKRQWGGKPIVLRRAIKSALPAESDPPDPATELGG